MFANLTHKINFIIRFDKITLLQSKAFLLRQNLIVNKIRENRHRAPNTALNTNKI